MSFVVVYCGVDVGGIIRLYKLDKLYLVFV